MKWTQDENTKLITCIFNESDIATMMRVTSHSKKACETRKHEILNCQMHLDEYTSRDIMLLFATRR